MFWYRIVGGVVLLLAFVSSQGVAQQAGVSPAELQRSSGGAMAPAEPEMEEEPGARVVLASPQVLPGGKAYVTVLLSNAPEVSVSQMEHWLEFPQDKLSFVSARLGISADLARSQLELDQPAMVSGAAPNQMSLHFAVKAQQPIPDGPVLELTFDVGEVPPGTIVLPHKLVTLDSGGRELANVEFADARIIVSEQLPDAPPAIFSCLFYMH